MFNAKSNRPQKDLVIHILLLAFLRKLWLWPWMYQTAFNVQKGIPNNGYKRTPGGQLLMIIFVPFYSLYWFYKTGKIISEYSEKNGTPMKIGGLCCVVSLFSAKVASIIMQMEMNKIEELPCVEDDANNKTNAVNDSEKNDNEASTVSDSKEKTTRLT